MINTLDQLKHDEAEAKKKKKAYDERAKVKRELERQAIEIEERRHAAMGEENAFAQWQAAEGEKFKREQAELARRKRQQRNKDKEALEAQVSDIRKRRQDIKDRELAEDKKE